MAKRDKVAEITARWRKRDQCGWALITPWSERHASIQSLRKSFDIIYGINEQCHKDIGHLLRLVAKAEKVEKKP